MVQQNGFRGTGAQPAKTKIREERTTSSLSRSKMDRTLDSISDLSSDSDSYSDPDTEFEMQSDSDSEPDGKGPGIRACETMDEESDSEADEIMKNIDRLRKEGPARPNHAPRTKQLWQTESEFWGKYAGTLQKKTGLDAEDLLRSCDPSVFKAYLSWRRQKSQIKKESTMKAYWKRLSQYYHHVTGYAMSNEVLKDICNWIPSLDLDRSVKKKLAMYVQTLYAIIYALWVYDPKPLLGFIRIQISLLLLLSAATATRPGALVESASNRGSNKVLCFRDVDLIKVRSREDPNKSTIIANVNLEHVKNKGRGGTPKQFTFRLEALPALCIVTHFLGIGQGRNAFKDDDIKSVQDIFNLEIPEHRNILRIKWKTKLLDQPFFCDFEHTIDGGRIREDKAFPYAKYRDAFIRLGLILGIEEALELYQLRRASGAKINAKLTPAERNQIMDQRGDTYERYYIPTHSERDVQAIYFGTPSDEELIQSVASIGLSQDRRAPMELNEKQQKELQNDPLLTALREERGTLKQKLYSQGFIPLSTAQGTQLHNDYEKKKKEIASTYQNLHRKRLKEVIREFHETIDAIEIAKQLSGKAGVEVLEPRTVEFELPDRAIIAAMLFKPFEDNKTRVEFAHTLARLFTQRESRQPKAIKRAAAPAVMLEEFRDPLPAKRQKTVRPAEICEQGLSGRLLKKAPDARNGEAVLEIYGHPNMSTYPNVLAYTNVQAYQSVPAYPNVPPYPVCGFCYGNEQSPYGKRTKEWSRKDVLSKHVDLHLRDSKYQRHFTCPYPACSSTLSDAMHFKRHSLDVHKVAHSCARTSNSLSKLDPVIENPQEYADR